jgi:hypothetical protein
VRIGRVEPKDLPDLQELLQFDLFCSRRATIRAIQYELTLGARH